MHSSRCPPSAAVRQRTMASNTLMCFQRIHWRFRSMKAAPAMRMRSAISSAGGVTGGTSFSNVTHIYIKTAGRSLLRSSCAASAAGRLRPNEETGKLRRAILGDTGIEEVLSTPHSPWQGEAPQERIQSKQKEHQSERDSGDNRDYLHVRNPFVSISLLSNNHSS